MGVDVRRAKRAACVCVRVDVQLGLMLTVVMQGGAVV